MGLYNNHIDLQRFIMDDDRVMFSSMVNWVFFVFLKCWSDFQNLGWWHSFWCEGLFDWAGEAGFCGTWSGCLSRKIFRPKAGIVMIFKLFY